MKTASIATFLAVTASTTPMGSAYERKLSDERRLRMGYYGDASSKFAKYLDIYERCCAPEATVLESDDSPCKCPVRTFNKWGFDIYSKWNDKCESRIKEKSSIAALAASNDDFSILAGLLEQYGLDAPLKGAGPFTVFAPNNAAFTALVDANPGILNNEKLVEAVLKYHVIVGDALKSGDLTDGQTATFNGASITVDTTSGVQIIDGTGASVNVIDPFDVVVSNGVVHTIERVLIPPSS